MAIKSSNKPSVEFSMASLTDIIFLLLIFFIILSTMINPYGEKVDLPNSSSRTTETPTVAVTIKKDLSYYIKSPNDKIDRLIDANNIEQELVNSLASSGNKRQAILYVDESVPTGFTINLFAIARKNNIDMVVATEPD